MKRALVVLGCGMLVACVKQVQDAPLEVPIAVVPLPATVAPLPPPDAPRSTIDRFPAGPGVTLHADQFQALLRDRRVMDRTVPYEQRLSLAQRFLGEQGEPYEDASLAGVAFYGIAPRGISAPFGCTEFIVARRGGAWSMHPIDHRRCGLPYAYDPVKPWRDAAPKRSAFRLEEVLAEAVALADPAAHVRAKLGAPDLNVLLSTGETAWAGIGGRTQDAPISCRALRIEGADLRIVDVPLASCGLAWPMPGMTFNPGTTEPPIDRAAKLAECAQKCSASEICMLDQRLPGTATIRMEPDGPRARFVDGRSAKVDVVASCEKIPPTCPTVSGACLFPTGPGVPPSGPCAHGFRVLVTAPTSHILCESHGPPPPPPPPPAAPPIPAPAKPKPTDKRAFELF